MPRPHRSFSRRVLISQLALVIVILTLITGVFAWMGARTVTEVTETKALATARTLAIDPDVRAAATQASAEHADEPDEQIVESMLAITGDLRDRSGITFAVITDDRGIRLTHPDRSKIGHKVSTSPDEALAGRENVSHESGTLGETVRAKVPIYSTEDGETVVGEVSVGIFASVLDADVRRELILLGTVAVFALALGGVVSVMLGRRLRRETLGIGPEELAEMARDQGAVLHGLDDGVLGFDTNGKLTLSNSNAKELLGTASVKHVDHANGTVDANGAAASAGGFRPRTGRRLRRGTRQCPRRGHRAHGRCARGRGATAEDHDQRPDPVGHGRAGAARWGLRRRRRDPARRDADADDGPPARIRHRDGQGIAHSTSRVRQPAAHRARTRRYGCH
ncbi:hypothetical protein [Brevibacterium linens]|uniref:hypothetical protein n=1 Tax=Brevibacterium linens TaxID=1703 RepID=UPI001F49972E|nr:hypothetical protein [Brevibacterium linens]